MPTDQLLSAAATTLRPFARRVLRLSSERRAAVPKLRTPHDIIEDLLDQTLHRLRKGDINDVWWKRILTHFAHNYITPDFLQKPALRGWLADHTVAVAFKALATHLIATGTAHDGEYPNVLVESYSSHTGEASHLATVPIEVVLAVLVAGYIASVPADQRASFGVIQAGNTFNQEGFARLENLILEGRYLNAHDAKKLQSELDAILLLRTIDAPAARDKIHALLNHANDIRLASTNSDLNDRITYWAARLLALDSATLPIAKQLRTQILAIHQSNTNIIDALIALTEGDTNQALRLVRDEPDSDSRSLFFSILADAQGERAALEWADQHESSSDPRFFNAQGWTNWAICCAKTDRWDQACQHLATLEHLSPNHPLLAFTEGRINAAMLLPQEYREIVLHEVPLYPNLTTHQGSVAEEHHRRAVDCLQAASEAIERIAHEPFTRLIRQWTLWLSLVDPRKDKAQSTRNDIQHRMRIGTEAAQLIPFALVFDIPFDDAPLKQHIASHRTFGGLGDQEFRAAFLLLCNSESPRNLLNYIDKHRTHLKKIFAPDLLTGAEVESLAADGQTQRARTLLQKNPHTFVDEDYSRLTLLIETHEGHDPRPHLEDIYSKTKSLADLKNLIAHLVAVNDTTELRTLTMDLFSRERTIQNSLQVVSALIGPTQFDYPSVIEFLDTIPDLVTQSDDLKSARAWAFLAAGRIHEAKIISDDLLILRQHPNDFRLDTKIIVASGDWERLGTAIHREWPRRHTHDAATVMHMAALARQSGQDPDRALELARIATQKAPDDPEILAAAYWLHCKLGAEAKADPNWLDRASVLSSEDEGPIWRIDLTEALNHFFPKRRDLMDQIERKWLGGELPIGGAATVLNASLARLLLHLPEQNARRLDGRERTILPTIDGGRSPCDLEPGWTIGLDVTSVMVLHFLGILGQTIGSFRHIKLSSDIMELLFHERDDALFHQPSRAASAKQICDLRNSDRIRLAKTGRRPPAELVEEVGLEMASLLHSADTNCGTVIAVLPLHRPESLLQERARTDTHEHLIISIVDFCAYLYQEGKLDADDHRRAISFLSSRNQQRTSGSPCSDTGPFYIDDVALTYLQEANLIEPLTAAGLDIQIHPNVHARAVALVEEGAAGYDIVATVDSIRTILRRAIDESTASFLPAMVSHDQPTQQDAPSLATTVSLLGAASACDALCIDDRYFNQRQRLSDAAERSIPIICVLDVLRYLQAAGDLDSADHWTLRHKLRRGGFAIVSCVEEELWHWLTTARFGDGKLTESAELRVIRQSLARLDAVIVPSETETVTITASLHRITSRTIQRLWADESLNIERVRALSSWVWRNLAWYVPPHGPEGDGSDRLAWLQNSTSLRVTELVLPTTVLTDDRRNQFAAWMEAYVLGEMTPANGATIDSVIDFAAGAISAVHQHQDAYGNLVLQGLPTYVRRLFIERNPSLASRCGFTLEPTIGLGGDEKLRFRDLKRVATTVLDTRSEQIVRSDAGVDLVVGLNAESEVELRRLDTDGAIRRIRMPELGLYSTVVTTREEARRYVVDRIGATGPAFVYSPEGSASRGLSDNEIERILGELANGVVGTQQRLNLRLQRRQPITVRELVPEDLSYYEKLCGPQPRKDGPESYIREVLIPYRQTLLERHLSTALDVCLLGSVRDDLSPGRWLSGVPDDEVWAALEFGTISYNPFSLLGALDAALYRQHDPRFQEFARSAISRLCSDTLPADNGVDVYSVLPSLFEVVLCRLNMIPDGAKSPGYWKRMCAWMQAAMISRALLGSLASIDTEWLAAWIQSGLVSPGAFATLADLRNEPVYLATRANSDLLRYEIGSRLAVLRRRHEEHGRTFSVWETIGQGSASSQVLAGAALSQIRGPLEAHRAPTEPIPGDLRVNIEESWSQGDVMSALQRIANASQCYRMSEEELGRVRRTIGEVTKGAIDEGLDQLSCASIIAVTNRDRVLADHVGEAVVMMAPDISETQVHGVFQIVLRTAAAHMDEDEWRDWLEGTFSKLARRLPRPPSRCLEVLRNDLSLIGSSLPMDLWFQVRPMLVASSGMG